MYFLMTRAKARPCNEMLLWTLLLILAMVFAGCAVTTTVTMPNNDVYVVHSKPDAIVEVADGDKKIMVDNRGRPGMIEQALGIMFLNLPDVELKP